MAEEGKSFIAGWAGGASLLIVGHPFDTVKTLLQSDKEGLVYKNAGDCARQIVKRDGVTGLWRGVQAPLVGVGTVFAAYFLAYAAMERFIRAQKGYSADQELSMMDILVCGGSTGIVGSLILGPAELLKVQQQTAISKGLDPALGATVKRLYGEGGVRALTRGFGATLARDVPGSMAWFGAYEVVKSAVSKDPKKPGVGEALLAGGCGGMAMWSFALPMDAIKTRVQSSKVPMSMAAALKEIISARGVAGLYVGIVPALLRAFPANAACFAGKEFTKQQLDKVF